MSKNCLSLRGQLLNSIDQGHGLKHTQAVERITHQGNQMTNLVPDYNNSYICPKCNHQTPLYVKEWVGLTDEEIKACAKGGRSIGISFHDAIRKAEAKLREKNET